MEGETPEAYKKRTGHDVPPYMATYTRCRMSGKKWNSWRYAPYRDAQAYARCYHEHEIILANSDFCPIGADDHVPSS
jgi:hypothetical protein